jgi:putative transposase
MGTLYEENGDVLEKKRGRSSILLTPGVRLATVAFMPRHARQAPGGFVYHALNRAVARLPLFQKPADYAAFERVLAEALQEHPTGLLAYCLLPNHWHVVLWPREEGELTAFLRWLTHTHSMRWHAHYHTGGTGHIYQGRFKSFPVEADDHLYTLVRYVERNALRANLVSKAEDWRWGSLWRRQRQEGAVALHPWPVPLPQDWVEQVNAPQTAGELEAVRRAVVRGCPFGSAAWQRATAQRLGLEKTLRPKGRPKKNKTTAPA